MHSPSCLLPWAAAGIGFRISFLGMGLWTWHWTSGALGASGRIAFGIGRIGWFKQIGRLVRASARESWVHAYAPLPKYQVTYMYAKSAGVACNVVLCIVLALVADQMSRPSTEKSAGKYAICPPPPHHLFIYFLAHLLPSIQLAGCSLEVN